MGINIEDKNVFNVTVRTITPSKVKGVSIIMEKSGRTVSEFKERFFGFKIDDGVVYSVNDGNARVGNGDIVTSFIQIWVVSGESVVRIKGDGTCEKVRKSQGRDKFIESCRVLKNADGILAVLKEKNATVKVVRNKYNSQETFLFFDDVFFHLGCKDGFDQLVEKKIINKQGKIIAKKFGTKFLQENINTLKSIARFLANGDAK